MLGTQPRTNEKRKHCNRCGVTTVYVFDHGKKMYICSECEL